MRNSSNGSAEPMIRLEQLSKRFPGQPRAAVEDLSLDIPEGEIVVLVGPSGCGKTTTMKMINRLVEPSSGRIILEGEDVTGINAATLRRRIGYVIQQIGLFQHMTIAANIATVPKLLGWESKRTRERVDELLNVVGLDPAEYRDRYPKELSGGERQRVGVARALSADPPVMLMDEPFGAIDPITRARLQDEFLRVQADIRKTIVFVTHDIDEAIKMGDRIAILRRGAHIAQYDTPEHILSNRADEFVDDFIGEGASVKRLNLTRVGEIELAQVATISSAADRAQAEDLLRRSDADVVLVLDESGTPLRWATRADLDRLGGREGVGAQPADGSLREVGAQVRAPIERRATLHAALNQMLSSVNGRTVVVDDAGAYQGVVDLPTIMSSIQSMTADARHDSQSEEVAT